MEPLLFFYSTISFILIAILYHKLRPPQYNAPPTYPIIGCLIAFYKNRHQLLSWYTDLLAVSQTQTVVIRRMGARRTVITANPKNVEYMLKTNFVNFPKGKPFTDILKDFLGFGIFNVDGEMWHAQRKLATYQFTSRLVKQHVEVSVEELLNSKLFPLLDSFSDSDYVVDLQEVLRRFGFDVVCKFALGFDPNCVGDRRSFADEVPILRAFDTAAEVSAKRGSAPISAVWKLKRMLGIGSEKVLKDCVKEIHEYVTEIISIRIKEVVNESNKNQDLLSKLIIDGVSEELIRDMVISFIMAGRDTTSAAMTWLFYALSRNTDVEERLVNEIGLKFNHKVDNFKDMKYLQACIYETMRLYPPVSWDSKHALNADVLPDGTLVNAGDRVTYIPYGMGRMESIWGADRLEFKPDRWFEPTPGQYGDISTLWLKDVSPYKYPVFHAGPRVCLGKGMASAQMSYVVASLVERFEIKPVGSGEALYLPALTARMHGGFNVVIRRRRRSRDANCQDNGIKNWSTS